MKSALAITMFVVVVPAVAQRAPAKRTASTAVDQQLRAGDAAREAGRFDDAMVAYERAKQLAPASGEVWLRLGMIRHEQFRYADAIPMFQKALALRPGLAEAHALLGLDYFQTGEVAKAVQQLELAFKADPSNPQYNGWLGMSYVAAGLFRPAVPRLEFALQGRSNSVLFAGYLVRAYGGATDQAQQVLNRIAKGSPEGHLALAQAYLSTGNRDVALEEYRAALEADPKLIGINRAIGDIHSALGQFAEAEQAYRREVALSPQSTADTLRLGTALAELGRAEEALPLLRAAATDPAAGGEALFYLGKVHYDLDHLSDAENSLRRALARPVTPQRLKSIHYQLWMTYRKLGAPDRAAAHLDQFRRLEAELRVLEQRAR